MSFKIRFSSEIVPNFSCCVTAMAEVRYKSKPEELRIEKTLSKM